MKVGIVNDFAPADRSGGASRAIQLFLRAKPDDVEFVYLTPGNLALGEANKVDGYILFLTRTFSFEEMSFLQQQNYVWCGFDWWPDQDGLGQWRNLIVDESRLAVFVSPLHEQRFKQLHNVDPVNSVVLPPPMDFQALQAVDLPDQRLPRAVWASEWHVNKGPDLAAVLAKRLGIHLDMFSPSMPADVLRTRTVFTPFAHPAGFHPEETWYETLARYQMLLHTPRVPDAFGYITLEAYALGLEVHVTGRTGVESFNVPLDNLLQMCSLSGYEFWRYVQEAL